jgi:hypothetical protein
LVNENDNYAEFYGIINTKGDLQKIGIEQGNSTVSINPDNVSLVIDDNKLAMKNYGKRYYRYVDGNYVLQEVNTEFPWKMGLSPRVSLENGELVLGWYEFNFTNIDEINSQITTLTQ